VSRQLTSPSGASRATLFALGLTLAGQACEGERAEKKDDSFGYVVPPYGAMPCDPCDRPHRETCADNPLLADCRGSSGGGAGGSGAGGSGATNNVGGNAGSSGALTDAGTSGAGASLDAGAEDAGRDAAADDAGN